MAITTFGVGDTVKILKNNEHVNVGDLGKILMVHPKDYFGLYNWEMENVWANNIAPFYYYTPGYSCNDETIVASSLWTKTKTMLNTLTTALRKALSPALQKQYRAGLINGGLELTSRGQQELLAILAEEKSKELTAVAQEIIDEAEKD